MRSFMIVLLARYKGDEGKANEMDVACGIYGVENKYIVGFGGKP
jgi:hypothetical protein